jgi:hypothetical protein
MRPIILLYFIEVTSGTVLLWRMSVDANVQKREQNERLALRVVGSCFLALGAYIAYESASGLWSKKAPEHSIPGIVLACVSLVVMPLLSRAKQKVGRALGSAAIHADAKQTEFCAYLSGILLVGLLLNALFSLWWSDSVAGLVMVRSLRKRESEAYKAKPATIAQHRDARQHRLNATTSSHGARFSNDAGVARSTRRSSLTRSWQSRPRS